MGTAFFWKLLERFGVLGSQFVLQIILARLLVPEHYGALSMMTIFISLANVFIQHGLNTALIQNKDVEEQDYSSVFWINVVFAVGMYAVLYCAAPWIAQFYSMPEVVSPFRVLMLVLFPGAINSVQLAVVSRKLDFKRVFRSNVLAIVLSGILGILLAVLGAGLWALVLQSLTNVIITCIVMWNDVKWRPTLTFNFGRVKVLFSFGWKLMVSSFIDALYRDLRSLVIGKKYDSGTLGYYNRGKQFPQFAINAINGAVQSVMLPAMSAEQDNKERVKSMMRSSITLSAYVIFPMMAGLAAVAPALIELLLTEKWLPSVPYMQIYCFTLAFYPVHSCNLQAINAMGRSDLFLRLEMIKKMYGLVALVIAVVFFDSPIAIAMTGAVTTLISCFVNASPNKKLINYSYTEQMRDVLPAFFLSIAMFTVVVAIGNLQLPIFLTLMVQCVVGVLLYVLLSIILKLESFIVLKNTAIRLFRNKRT